MKMTEAMAAAGKHGRIRSERFSNGAVGIHEIDDKPYLYFYDEGEPQRMLSVSEVNTFLTNGFTDWRPAN